MRRIAMSGLVALATVLGTAASGTAASASVALPVSAPVPLTAAPLRLTAAAVLSPPAAHTGSAVTVPTDQLADVSCVSAKDCLAVGANANGDRGNGSPLAETWNGSRWKQVSVKLPAGASGGILTSVSCKSATYCVAVGYHYDRGGNEYALADAWSGSAWKPAKPPAPVGANLNGVSCATTKSCLAVGQYNSPDIPLAEFWNGTKWTREKPPAPSGSGADTRLLGVWCVSATYCVTVGSNGVSPLADAWNGRAFTKLRAPEPPPGTSYAEPMDVSCTSAKNCVAVGLGMSASFSVTSMADTWNGTGWTAAKVPWPKGTTSPVLVGVSCTSAKSCVAVGATAFTLTNNNSGDAAAASFNGKAWSVTSVPAPAKGKASVLAGVTCLSATDCAAVGDLGPTNSANSNGLSGFWNGRSWKLVTAI